MTPEGDQYVLDLLQVLKLQVSEDAADVPGLLLSGKFNSSWPEIFLAAMKKWPYWLLVVLLGMESTRWPM